jgi:hypothetical protein
MPAICCSKDDNPSTLFWQFFKISHHLLFLARLTFHPWKMQPNAGWLSTSYTALYPLRLNTSWALPWEPRLLNRWDYQFCDIHGDCRGRTNVCQTRYSGNDCMCLWRSASKLRQMIVAVVISWCQLQWSNSATSPYALIQFTVTRRSRNTNITYLYLVRTSLSHYVFWFQDSQLSYEWYLSDVSLDLKHLM